MANTRAGPNRMHGSGGLSIRLRQDHAASRPEGNEKRKMTARGRAVPDSFCDENAPGDQFLPFPLRGLGAFVVNPAPTVAQPTST